MLLIYVGTCEAYNQDINSHKIACSRGTKGQEPRAERQSGIQETGLREQETRNSKWGLEQKVQSQGFTKSQVAKVKAKYPL